MEQTPRDLAPSTLLVGFWAGQQGLSHVDGDDRLGIVVQRVPCSTLRKNVRIGIAIEAKPDRHGWKRSTEVACVQAVELGDQFLFAVHAFNRRRGKAAYALRPSLRPAVPSADPGAVIVPEH
jgi:hypothetical protein